MKWKIALFLVAAVVAVGIVNYLRPIPAVAATSALHAQDTVPGTIPKIPWPSGGSAVIGTAGLGLIAMSGNESPISAASVTKVMTALLILTDKPLKKDETGPTMTITDTDVQSYLTDQANKESVVAVQAGEQLRVPAPAGFADRLGQQFCGDSRALGRGLN